MKTLRPLAWLVWIAVFSAVSSAQEESAPPTQTLAPFFFIQTDDPNLDPLPLKSISAAVRISGVIADVTIEQVYMNEGESPLEATYIFPASTGAAVYGMKMTIGQRSITAEIREREEARQEYEEARDEGKSASLLEQQRPNVFQMHVANLLPGDTIQVQLKYTELLVPTEGIYEFIYPTVVGPRYSSTPLAETESRDLFVATPYLHEGKSAPYDFDITVDLTAGLPIQELVSTSHQVDINFADTDRAGIRLSASEESPGNRDFILRYKLRGERIAAGLLLYQGEQENFFLFMGQPPERVDTAAIPPREYIFIVDVSGSMRGFPLTVSKALLRDLISSLQPTDTFNVLLFAGTSVLMSPESVAATADNINWAIDVIDNQSGGGGTRILSAMGRALQLPRPTAETARTIVIVTDGYVHVEAEAFQLIRDNLHDANLFAFGIGSSVNRFIIEGMARAGMGEPFVVTREGEAQEKAAQFREYIRTPVLSQVEFDAGGLDIYDVEPVSIPDILAERPVIVFGKWRGEPEGTMSLTGKTGLGDYTTQIDLGQVEPTDADAALRYLWARHRISILGDFAGPNPTDELKSEITRMGLAYNLLTSYTSFVAVDRIVRNDGTELTEVKQPLPLPQGVEDSAVGGVTASAVTEPLMTTTWFGKTFYLNDGVWVDSAYLPGMPLEDYRAADGPLELQSFASLERDMIVVARNRAFRLQGSSLPIAPILFQNAPNPFNSGTVIRFQLSDQGGPQPIGLAIYDLTGQKIRTYSLRQLGPGEHQINWDGRDNHGRQAGSGTYLYHLTTPNYARTRKMILLR